MVKKLLALTMLLLAAWGLKAQLPPPCPSNTTPAADLCSDICIYCNFNGYMGSSAGYTGQTPPGFCGTIENEQWLGFIAGSPAATFTATPSNCATGNGVQIALYTDCNSSPVACNGGSSGGGSTPVSITANLTPGVNYFLLIDGYAGDQCDFTITVVPPSAVQAPNVGPTGNISGPAVICPGATVTYTIPTVSGAGAYTWDGPPGSLINGVPPPVTFPAPGGNTVQITMGPSGGQVCVTPANSCNDGVPKCKNVIVQPIPPTILPPAVVCNEDLPYELPWGDFAYNSGVYETTFVSYQGCDSVVRKQLTVKQPIITYLPPKTVCAGSCITVCGEEYCEGGSFSHICESYQGCDSLVNFSILVLEPLAEIIPNGVLSCNNDTITLTSTPSPGTKVWKTPAGTILGTGNSLIVTQPGTIILTVTASAGGNYCIAMDTIVITGNTTPPTVSATGGVLGCGNPQAQLNTTTNATNPTYAWGPPTGLSATNIANPIATLSGTYIVTVTSSSNGCTNTASVTVVGNTTPPSASATGGVLTCTTTSINLTAVTNAPPTPTYSWSGPNGFTSTSQSPMVSATGTYTVTITSSTNNCTASATTSVTVNNTPPTVSVLGDTINCLSPVATLTGNSTTTGATFAWTSPNGFSSNQQNPTTDTAGVYTLTVTNPVNGCTATATTSVIGNTNAPTASAVGGTISCAMPDLDLDGGSTTPGVTYAWTGPNGFSSTKQDPTVTAPGIYTLTVTGPNACTQTASATVDGDFAAPDASATGGVITCTSSTTIINGASTTPGVTFTWIGPSGGNFSGPNPTVSNTGIYTLTVTSLNGCTATATATVDPDANVPSASAAGGTLNCNITDVMLDGGSTTPGITLQWTGPNNFSSTLEDPTVSVPGVYTLTVSNPANGCTAVATADVILDDAPPGATATGGTVTCAAPNLDLDGDSPSNNVTWEWTGPNNFTSTDQSPNTSEPGTYLLTVTGVNGCTSTAETQVIADQTLPNPTSTTGTLTCALTNLTLNGGANVPVSFSWTGPNSFSSGDQNPVVNMPGDYTLVVTDSINGCTNSTTITVDQDIAAPEITAAGNTISCSNPQVALSGSSTTPGATLAWVGPSFNSTQPNPLVSQNGTYTLTVTAPNGCTSDQSVDVLLDTEAPNVITQTTGILTCATTSIGLATTATNATSPIQTYSWTGPNSFTSALEDPSVTEPGDYILVVTSANGCSTSASATVAQDIVPPDVSVQGGTLTCLITEIQLDGGSSTPNATFAWQGPNFTSTLQDPTINEAGNYILTVTGPNGCTAASTAVVVLDGDFPDAQAASSNNLDCDELTTTLSGTSITPGVSYSWQDTSGIIVGVTQNVMVSEPGVFQLSVTAPNGCVSTTTVLVTQDIALPGASAQGDTIDCISGQTPIMGGSPTTNVTWSWTGPGGFTSNMQNPIASEAGVYTLTVTGQNACTSTATASVAQNTQSPTVTVTGAGTLTCLVTDLTLTGTIGTIGATGVWTDAAGMVLGTSPSIDVSTPGVYTYTVTAQNGCISAPTLTVIQNIVTPQNVVVSGGLINCTTPTLALTATTTTPMVSYLWTGPGGITTTQQNPVINAAGTYTVLITNQANGCQATAVTTVTADFAVPNITATTQTITCALPTVTIDATSTTPNVQYNWAGPGINASNKTVQDPQVSVAGTYSVTVTAANGCTSTFTLPVSDDVVAPDVATTGVTLTCTQPSNNITGTSQTPGVAYAWTGPNGFVSTNPNPTVTEVGNYILTVTAPNGCTASSTAVVLPDASLPTVTATGGTLTCSITSLQLSGNSNDPNVTWEWSGPGGFSSTLQNPTINTAGTYSLTVTALNGCKATTTATVLADTNGPVVNTAVPNQLDCNTTQVSLTASVQAAGNYSYQWSTNGNGNIVSGQSSPTPVVSTAATYSVVVTNLQNGCTTLATVNVVVDSATISDAVLNVRGISCYGKTDGSIGVANVIGGTPPFLYSFDNRPFSSSSVYTSLAPGVHTLVIQDANGCEWGTSKVVEDRDELLIDLGADTLVPLGYSIQLSLKNTVNHPDWVKSLILDPPSLDTAFCDDDECPLTPANSFRYFVTVIDSNGCKATDNRTIIVDKTRHIYIPNIFNPDALDEDAKFFISGDTRQVLNIKSFRVFDRWGNAVYEQFNFLPNNPADGWDGLVRGDKANPAVFVYYAEIEFIDNEVILYKGDVTLIRK